VSRPLATWRNPGDKQEEIGAGWQLTVAGELPQIEQGEAPDRDQPAGQLAPPRDRETRDHPNREEQKANGLTCRQADVLPPSECERQEEQGAGDAPRPSGPTQGNFQFIPDYQLVSGGLSLIVG
jgi:hypothetical protein